MGLLSFTVLINRMSAFGMGVRIEIVDRDFGFFGTLETQAEGAVGDQAGAATRDDSTCPSEMIGMGMGDDDRMDIFDPQLCLFETVLKGLERTRRGEAWINDCSALGVRDRIAVDVAEPWHGNWELHPKHI